MAVLLDNHAEPIKHRFQPYAMNGGICVVFIKRLTFSIESYVLFLYTHLRQAGNGLLQNHAITSRGAMLLTKTTARKYRSAVYDN